MKMLLWVGESYIFLIEQVYHVFVKESLQTLNSYTPCISFKFIESTLKYFGFGPNYIKWINILLHILNACINHAGNISHLFFLSWEGVDKETQLRQLSLFSLSRSFVFI